MPGLQRHEAAPTRDIRIDQNGTRRYIHSPVGNYLGEAGYAPFHDQESNVPAEVKTKMEEIDKMLKDGSLKTNVAPAKP